MAKRDEKVELVGLLPLMLMSKELFPTHQSLLSFSGDVLQIKLKNLSRPSRTRIIGEILYEVTKIPAKDLDRVLDKLQVAIRDKQTHTKSDFFVEWDSAIRRMRSGARALFEIMRLFAAYANNMVTAGEHGGGSLYWITDQDQELGRPFRESVNRLPEM